jgi:hypothetical protein
MLLMTDATKDGEAPLTVRIVAVIAYIILLEMRALSSQRPSIAEVL